VVVFDYTTRTALRGKGKFTGKVKLISGLVS